MESRLNHTRIGAANGSMMQVVYFALLYCLDFLKEGAEVEELRLETSGTFHVCEKGFREFIKRVTSIEVDESKLSTTEIQSLNRMKKYLTPTVENVEFDEESLSVKIEKATAKAKELSEKKK